VLFQQRADIGPAAPKLDEGIQRVAAATPGQDRIKER